MSLTHTLTQREHTFLTHSLTRRERLFLAHTSTQRVFFRQNERFMALCSVDNGGYGLQALMFGAGRRRRGEEEKEGEEKREGVGEMFAAFPVPFLGHCVLSQPSIRKP